MNAGSLKPVRGSRQTITCCTSATAKDIVNATVLKMSSLDKKFDRSATYKLMYPDGTVVDTLRTSEASFTLQGHKDELDVDYYKVVLFIMIEG